MPGAGGVGVVCPMLVVPLGALGYPKNSALFGKHFLTFTSMVKGQWSLDSGIPGSFGVGKVNGGAARGWVPTAHYHQLLPSSSPKAG